MISAHSQRGNAVVVAVLSCVAILAAWFQPAHAHDAVVASNPENGSTVSEFPSEIVLTFSGQIQDDFNTVAVSNQDSGEVLFDLEPKIDGFDVIIPVPSDLEVPNGNYVVGFQVTSSDGHVTRGSISFELAGDENASEADASGTVAESIDTTATTSANDAVPTTSAVADSDATAEEDSSESNTVVIWLAGIAIVVVLGAVIFWQRAKKHNNGQRTPQSGTSNDQK
ncbi:MAG: copper resistance protein CopC [Corynebacterium sp.]|nr:copper resistance protein CopC [Corynebacterium sp.]